ncbi:MAG: GspE/PulE family protein, partial [Planctomycetota bacterium]
MAKRRTGKTKPPRLGDVLVEHGLITREQRREALARQKETDQRLGEVLVEQGTLTRDELNWALGNLLGVPYVELDPQTLDPALVRAVPAELLRRYQVVPMVQVGEELTLAMADPTDSQAAADVAAVTGARVKPAMADADAVADALDALAPAESRPAEPRLSIPRSRKRKPSAEELLADPSGEALIQHHLREACKQGADEVLFEPAEDVFGVRYRVHGALKDQASYPASFLGTVVTRLKLMAGLELEGGALFQEGQAALDMEGRALELLASVYATVHGPGARIQIRAKRAEPWAVGKLGFGEEALAALRRAAAAPAGLLVVCGPRRSGCSTTLYALLAEMGAAARRVVTLQDFTSYRFAEATQIEVPRGPDYDRVVS